MILELVCVVAKEFSPMDLLEKLPETIIVLTVLVLQRGLEPRPLRTRDPVWMAVRPATPLLSRASWHL